jgi:uncharacterized membrane protein
MLGLTTLAILRIVHIVAGAFWVGGVLFLAAFLLPSVRAIGSAAGPIMQQLSQVRRLPTWFMGASILGLLSGIVLYWHDSAGFTSGWLGTGPGKVFGAGGVLALVAAVLGPTVTTPAARRLGALMAQIGAAGRAPSAEEIVQVRQLQARLGLGTIVGAVLLLLATTAMAVARYVP